MTAKWVTVLGSTGSIGKNTLAVIDECRGQFNLFALTARQDVETLFHQCLKFQPKYAVLLQSSAAKSLKERLAGTQLQTIVLNGMDALIAVASDAEVDIVMAAIVGSSGLKPTLAAVNAGKKVLLANKESLVMAGNIFMQAVKRASAELIPIDSEHNAIFQCLQDENLADVKRLILTASGGPLWNLPKEMLENVSPDQACAHPNWSMGKKISIDSATLMNKGLELIEAHWLFNVDVEKLDVVIHPQSIIHSLVEYCDGSTLAQLGYPDMKTPIAVGLGWPERLQLAMPALDLISIQTLTFVEPDECRFPCLKLAKAALAAGGSAPTVLNAANEVAVTAFLEKKMKFTNIAELIDYVVDHFEHSAVTELENILEIDLVARRFAENYVDKFN